MLSKTLLFILILTASMVVHELGHIMFGIIFKTKIKGIHIFYCPGIRLLSSHSKWILSLFPRLTTYPKITIGLLPFVSLVQFEYSMSEDKDDHDSQLLENKPAWQRLFVYSGGVLMNYVTAIIVAFFLEFHYSPMLSTYDAVRYSVEDTNHEIGQTTIRLSATCCSWVAKVCCKDENISKYSSEQNEHDTSGEKGTYYKVINTLSPSPDYHCLMMLWQFNIIFFVFNLIPLSPLDGGKILLCTYEMIFRRKPNYTLTIVLTLIGLVSLLCISLYTIFDEIIKDL